MRYLCEQTLDLAFNPQNVDRSDFTGRLYVSSGQDDGKWRWLTPAEAAEMETYAAAERARLEDDGHAGAIGHAVAHASTLALTTDDGNEDDLGDKWGQSAQEEPAEFRSGLTEAYEQAKKSGPKGEDISYEVTASERMATTQEIDEVYRIAHKQLEESRADFLNKRFVIMVFDMANVDPATTVGDVEAVTLTGTAADDMISNYLMEKRMREIQSGRLDI